jgi:hypothetical protein
MLTGNMLGFNYKPAEFTIADGDTSFTMKTWHYIAATS